MRLYARLSARLSVHGRPAGSAVAAAAQRATYRVPAGSVAAAGRPTAIYPWESRAAGVCWGAAWCRYFFTLAGCCAVAAGRPRWLPNQSMPPNLPRFAALALRILRCRWSTRCRHECVVCPPQDRPSRRHGVAAGSRAQRPASGRHCRVRAPLQPAWLRLANLLAGNDEHLAAIEFFGGLSSCRPMRRTAAWLAGPFSAEIVAADGGGGALDGWRSATLAPASNCAAA